MRTGERDPTIGATAGRDSTPLDVAVVGAGFAGLYALYRLRGQGLRVRAFETGDDVGGAWYWNRYPGARCDTNSQFYCYSFSDELRAEWTWTHRYPSRAELLSYLRHVADKFDLREDIRFGTRIVRADYDEATAHWTLHPEGDEPVLAHYCILAVGCLTEPQVPDIDRLDAFVGECYHTARWPEPPPDLHGHRVGVIGTGSSGVQVIPVVARQARHLVVFQRTANYVLPARNARLDPAFLQYVNANYADLRQRARTSESGVPLGLTVGSAMELSPHERQRIYQERWDAGGVTEFLTAFSDVRSDLRANETAAEFIRSKIREIVRDPATAELLCPRVRLGAKRTQLATDYYETFNRDNVELVDVSQTPIGPADASGLCVGDKHYDLARIIFATGFDAFTGALLKIAIAGRDRRSLREEWRDGPRTYLGLATSGFPNLFMINGPGSPSVLGNVVVAIEQHVEWLADLLAHVTSHGIDRVEARRDAQDRWADHVREVGSASIISTGNSWYVGANIPGKPRVVLPYTGGYGRYREICDDVARNGYEGFELRSAGHGQGVAA